VVVIGQGPCRKRIKVVVQAGRDYGIREGNGDNFRMSDMGEGANGLEDLGCDSYYSPYGLDRNVVGIALKA